MVDTASKTVPELIDRFERDILYDAHSFRARFCRSGAQKELVRRGRAVLKEVADHLRGSTSTDAEVATAWGRLLSEIEKTTDPERSGPQMLRNTIGWAAWAERFAV